MASAVVTHELTKSFRTRRGRRRAVDGLSLEVPHGVVHGLLGPNGSGKTTTIRMLTGLVRPDSGTISIFGHEVPPDLPKVIDRIGAVVENPKFVPSFTGRLNLELLARAIGSSASRIDAALEETELVDAAAEPYTSYSLGMKQRLGIAAALLKDSLLVIFDEPSNGLDPAGIREIRRTMRAMADGGRTVIVSSHVLAEVEVIADSVSIVSKGRLVTSGPMADVLGDRRLPTVRVGVLDPAAAEAVLNEAGYAVRLSPEGRHVLVSGADEREAAAIAGELARHGLEVSDLRTLRPTLEDVFIELTAKESVA